MFGKIKIYLFAKSIPELRNFSSAERKCITKTCFPGRVIKNEKWVWVGVIIHVILFYTGLFVGIKFNHKLLGLCIGAAVGSVVFLHFFHLSARPHIQRYLQKNERD
jgi:hypothetical protein